MTMTETHAAALRGQPRRSSAWITGHSPTAMMIATMTSMSTQTTSCQSHTAATAAAIFSNVDHGTWIHRRSRGGSAMHDVEVQQASRSLYC